MTDLRSMSDTTLSAYVDTKARMIADLIASGGPFSDYDRATVEQYKAGRDHLMERLTGGDDRGPDCGA